MPEFQSPIFDDDPRYHRQRKKSSSAKPVVILLSAAGGVLLLGCAGIFIAFWPRTLEVKRESIKEKHAKLLAAFTADDVGVDDDELRSIQRFLDALAESTQQLDRDFASWIDLNRHIEAMKQSGVGLEISWIEEKLYRQQLPHIISIPRTAERISVVQVDLDREKDEAIIYALIWSGNRYVDEARMWLVRNHPGWKLFDWELLQFGTRESAYHAELWKYEEDARMDGLVAMRDDFERAEVKFDQGDGVQAAKELRKAERRKVIPILKNSRFLEYAYSWERCGYDDEAIRVCLECPIPELAPGVLLQLSTLYFDQGKYEESLKYALKYEQAMGGGPNVNRYKALAYESLGQDSKAASTWLNYLKHDPNDMHSMRVVGRLLKEDEMHRLRDHVASLDSKVETATTLAAYFIRLHNQAAADAMGEILNEGDSNAARLTYLKGQQFYTDEWYEEAVEQFKQAFHGKLDESQRFECVEMFLKAMWHLRRPLEGYTEAPDAREAFYFLASGAYDGDFELSDADTERLLVMHRERDPKDPWLYYYAGTKFYEDQQFDEAIREFDAGLKLTDDEEMRSWLLDERLFSMARADRVVEAYEEAESKDETYQSLSSTLRYSDQFDALAQLNERHRADRPDDPWLAYYSAIVLAEQGQHQQADELLERAWNDDSLNEQSKRSMHYLRLQLRVKSGYRMQDYWDVEPVEQTFTFFASHFQRRHRWNELEQHLKEYVARNPASFDYLVSQVDFDWTLERYQSLIDRLTPFPGALLQGEEWEADAMREKLIRCRIRLGQIPKTASNSKNGDRGEQIRDILVAAVNHDVGTVTRLFEDIDTDDAAPTRLYYDEDIGAILFSEKFMSLRKKFPPSVKSKYDPINIVILYKTNREIDLDELSDRIGDKLPMTKPLQEIPVGEVSDSLRQFLVSIDDDRYCITFGRSKFHDPDTPSTDKVEDSKLKQAVDEHTTWIRIHNLTGSSDAPFQWNRMCQLASVLCDNNSSALYFSNHGRLLPTDEDTIQALNDDEKRSELIDSGESVFLSDVTDEAEQEFLARKARRRLRGIDQELKERKPDEEFLVRAAVYRDHHTQELIWIRLEEVRPGRYGAPAYIGRLTTDSMLVPQLRKDDYLSIQRHSIVDVKTP